MIFLSKQLLKYEFYNYNKKKHEYRQEDKMKSGKNYSVVEL